MGFHNVKLMIVALSGTDPNFGLKLIPIFNVLKKQIIVVLLMQRYLSRHFIYFLIISDQISEIIYGEYTN